MERWRDGENERMSEDYDPTRIYPRLSFGSESADTAYPSR